VSTLLGATGLAEAARTQGLAVLASAIWPQSTVDALPALPGFLDSSFSPLVAEVAERCLRQEYIQPPVPATRGDRTAIVVLSPLGDLASARRVAAAVAARARVGPLMFFQSVPNAVGGYVATRWGLAGPLVCLSGGPDDLDAVTLLLEDGDADEALVVLAEQASRAGVRDRAEAVLVRTASEAAL
jgi:hypothetical protein